MFTGIIEGLGTLAAVQSGGRAGGFTLTADFDLNGTRIGDSIAVNGACLTVTSLQGRRFTVDVSPETITKTTFAQARIGQKVNLERAMRLSDRLDGHLVSGHVDGVGQLRERLEADNAVVLNFGAPRALTDLMIVKGSVAVDGISLTINRLLDDGFEVSIIPHTARVTTIGLKPIGDFVNLETDLIGKYVERFLARDSKKSLAAAPNRVDMALLAKTGFLGK